MLQWLCALKLPADAAENDGTVDQSTADPQPNPPERWCKSSSALRGQPPFQATGLVRYTDLTPWQMTALRVGHAKPPLGKELNNQFCFGLCQ